MILVIGATGNTGKELVARLTSRGIPVRAMTRRPDTARALPGFEKAEVVYGEPAEPESLAAAFAGVEKVMLVSPSVPGWEDLRRNLFDAVRNSGVKHVVYLSVMGVSPQEPASSMRHHFQGEREIEQFGLAYTHLRANSFMQNFVAFYAPTIIASGAFYQCTGNARMAMIDTRDLADAALGVLTSAGHEGKTYELTGPEALNYTEAAARLSAAIGRAVNHVDLSAEDFSRAMLGAGAPAGLVEEIVGIYNRGYYGQGHAARVTDAVRQLTGHAPGSFDEFARDYAHYFAISKGV